MHLLTIFAEPGIMAHNLMMAKPMKTLELHYPMIQFLIILIIIHSKYFPVSHWFKPHA